MNHLQVLLQSERLKKVILMAPAIAYHLKKYPAEVDVKKCQWLVCI